MKSRPRRGGWPLSFLYLLTLALSAYTLGVYALSYTLWVRHWLAGFMMLSLPVAMALLLLAFGFWLLVQPRRAWVPLGVLLLGWPFWRRTVAWNHPAEGSTTRPLKVLSYNLRYFDVEAYSTNQQTDVAPPMVDWVTRFDADVKCFQEFYNWDEPRKLEVFRTRNRLRAAGYRHALLLNDKEEGFIGLAIFSRYPLIRRRNKAFSTPNGILVADLLRGRDTLRLINVQLYSMGIRVGKVLRQQTLKGAETETRGIAGQLKRGFQHRAAQVDEVVRLVRQSPYPVILCGDLNETPYGLAYGRLRRLLRNGFEDAGRGFGFTYNRQPKFIRIDNQFYGGKSDSALRITDFKTHEVRFSDHNPISAEYGMGE
jgi:endonuclease/exonuclease/phosphatase (EEP) superfamily protein YafD